MNYFRKPLYLLLLISILTGMLSLQPPEPVRAANLENPVSTMSPENAVRISQAYGDSGNDKESGYKNDFIELYNASDFPVNLDGWRVQYATPTGTTWQYGADLKGEIPAHGYYLIQGNPGSNKKGEYLPEPDVNGDRTLPMATAEFKIALTKTMDLLSGKCPTDSNIVDFLGIGGAECNEGSGTAPKLKSNQASIRKDNGCQDTDDNAPDFEAGTPNPRNSASPLHYCNVAPIANAQKVNAVAGELLEITLTGTDANGDALTFALVDVPQHGEAFLADNLLSYTAESNFEGQDSIAFIVNDGKLNSEPATVTINVTAGNNAPVLVTIPNATIPEMRAFGFIATATDVEKDDLTFSLVGGPEGASMTEEGVFSWTPSEAEGPGTYTFTVRVCDDESPALCAEQAVTLTVEEVNQAPVLGKIGDQEVVAMTEIEFTATATDPDLPANTLTFSLDGAPTGARIDATGGEFSWTPSDEQVGEHDFEVCVNDGKVTVCEEITITVTARNFAPVAVDDSYTTSFNTTLTVPVPGVLSNDDDPEDDVLSAIKLSDPDSTSGTLAFKDDGSFTYVPAIGFSGKVSFTYMANDGELDSNIATVTITVGTNTAPVAENQAVTTAEDTAKEITLEASDGDGDTLTYSIIAQPGHGSLSFVSGNKVTYTPALNYFGTDSFTFKANDSTLDSNTATVSISITSVEDLPVALPQDVSLNEDTSKEITLIASDGDGDPLTYTIVDEPTHGSLSLLSGNKITYTPDEKYFGLDSFTFMATDGNGWSEITTVTIRVNGPPIAENQDVITDEDTTKAITLIATDVDGQSLIYSIVGQPVHGSLSVISGNKVTYTPALNYFGTDSFTFKATDGTAESNFAKVSIKVTAVNDAPVAQIQTLTTVEETPIPISLLATDVDSASLTYSIVEGKGPTGGNLSPLYGNLLIYTPNKDYTGMDTFTFIANDGELDSGPATVKINVTEVNDAPVLTTIPNSTIPEMVPFSFTVEATDVDSENLTLYLDGAPDGSTFDATTGVFNWTPSEAQGVEKFEFTVKVCDNGSPVICAEQKVTLTVTEVNRAPVLTTIPNETIPEMVEFNLTANATDPDLPGNTLTFSLVNAPAGATIGATSGVFNWTPSEAQGYGVYTFTIKVCDNGSPIACAEQEVTLTVTEVNLTPVLETSEDKEIPEMEAFSFTAKATDPDLPANSLTFSLVDAPAGAAMTEAGVFSWTPTEVQGPKEYEFSVKVCDDASPALCAQQEVTLTVSEVNQAPVLTPIPNATISEMVAFSFTAEATDPDLPANSLTFSLVGAPASATIDATTGIFNWTPSEAQGYGVYTFTVKVCDDASPALCAEQEITLTVTEVNLTPILKTIEDKEIPEMEAFSFTAEATDPDLPANRLTFSLVDSPEGAEITETGIFNWTPTEAQGYGVYTFTVKVCDDASPIVCAEQAVTLTVTEVNLTPVTVDDSYTIIEDETLTILAVDGILANDLDDNSLTAILVDDVSHGKLTLNEDGSFTYKPNQHFNGNDSFTYKAKDDGGLESELAEVKITVTPVNDWVIAFDDDKYETLANVTLVVDVANGVLANDVLLDPDEEVLIRILDDPKHGTLDMKDDGSFTYIPDAGFMGIDTFRYMVLSVQTYQIQGEEKGGKWSDVATVTILVKPQSLIYLPVIYNK